MNPLPMINDQSQQTDPLKDLSAEIHTFKSTLGSHIFVTNGSRVYDIEKEMIDIVNNKLSSSKLLLGDVNENDLWDMLGLFSKDARYIDKTPLSPMNLSSLSLNVSQSCNMSCGYCYADMGKFGGYARQMELDIAKASVDRLITESTSGSDLVLGFMGGEPLLNRRVVHDITRYASKAAIKSGQKIRFSITTNATTITIEDAKLFSEFPFTVSISIDGAKGYNDDVRPMNDGSSSYDKLMAGLKTLNQYGRPSHLSARITVTPKTGELLPILDHVINLGFDDVGFASVLVSPIPSLSFTNDDFHSYLNRMIECGKKALREILAGKIYPFGNFETAIMQIHRGTHRPYPCGAGASYLSANAEGDLYACHRLIDDPKYAMGNVSIGSDLEKRFLHLSRSHVDLIEPCRHCWARYLCGGGCYHEVSRRGRIGCDYIRGWLDFCLSAYIDLISKRPDYFTKSYTDTANISSSSNTI